MYCTVEDMRLLLPEPISIGDNNIGTPSPGRPSTDGKSVITTEEAIRYIRMAEQEIDGRLRPVYVIPLRRIKSFETETYNDILPGTSVEVRVNDTGVFSQGQMIRLQTSDAMETDEIESIKNLTTLVIQSVKNTYPNYASKISILEFPDPVPFITARLAVSYAFDQLFSADQAPNMSEYGKEQRRLAINSFDSVMSGAILLFGQDHTGRRFVRNSVFDSVRNMTPDFQFGREKQ